MTGKAGVAEIPRIVLEHARTVAGTTKSIERLAGMSGGDVYRIRGTRRSVIAKRPAREAEVTFYRHIAPQLHKAYDFTPFLLDAVREDARWWLLLEDVSRPLPRERWLADPELLTALARLHALPLPAMTGDVSPYRPAWTPALSDRALTTLPAATAATITPPLELLQPAAQGLFAPLAPLSGDPNPTNWGLRDNGRIVLFDWERYCRGAPALDLAITIPGLGDANAFRLVARRYLTAAPSQQDARLDSLTREIAVAKVWSVVEFLAMASQESDHATTQAAWVAERVAPWLAALQREFVVS